MNINEKVIKLLIKKKLKISTAESITGGKLISYLIEIPGASKVIEESYIVYSNKAKARILGVDENLINDFGIVSKEVALEMARRTKLITQSDVVISTTGEAGPSLSDQNVGVGTVCFGLIINSREYIYKKVFSGDRLEIINNAISFILDDLFNKLT